MPSAMAQIEGLLTLFHLREREQQFIPSLDADVDGLERYVLM